MITPIPPESRAGKESPPEVATVIVTYSHFSIDKVRRYFVYGSWNKDTQTWPSLEEAAKRFRIPYSEVEKHREEWEIQQSKFKDFELYDGDVAQELRMETKRLLDKEAAVVDVFLDDAALWNIEEFEKLSKIISQIVKDRKSLTEGSNIRKEVITTQVTPSEFIMKKLEGAEGQKKMADLVDLYAKISGKGGFLVDSLKKAPVDDVEFAEMVDPTEVLE